MYFLMVFKSGLSPSLPLPLSAKHQGSAHAGSFIALKKHADRIGKRAFIIGYPFALAQAQN
ncbi:MAG: hypothetical protein V8Q79_04290 [Christensenellales bacterium]